MATIIRTDGSEETMQGSAGPGSPITLKQLQNAVGGGIEMVWPTRTGTLGRGEVLIVNDEGMVDGLPINARATELAGQDIAGDVVFAKFGTEVD